jgi:hypothetical protein
MCAIALLLGFGAVVTSQAGQERLADLVRSGIVGIPITKEYNPLKLTDLVSNSPLVARVRIASATPYETTPEAGYIATNYVAEVEEVILQRAGGALHSGTTIALWREGGELVIDQTPIRAWESSYPMFAVDEEYVLFLTFGDRNKAFVVNGGGQGAFRIDGNLFARQVTHVSGESPDQRPALDRPIDQLRTLILSAVATLQPISARPPR